MYFIMLVGILLLLLFLGSPVVFAIGSACWAYFIINPGLDGMLSIYVHKFFTGMDSFVLLCMPLFIMAGEIMRRSGMTVDLMRWTQIFVGNLKGGLAYVNVLVSMLFGGITGSGLADIAALGPIEIQAMEEDGYEAPFAVALTATSAIQGPIIPPSIPMVIFAGLTRTSIGALFLGGALPGVLIGLGQMLVIRLLANKKNFPKHEVKLRFKDILRITKIAIFALGMPIIVLGGIVVGVFTPTEASAMAAVYSLTVSIFAYRKNRLLIKDFISILVNTIRITTQIYLIIGFGSILSWIFAYEKLPEMLQILILKYDPPVYLLLFMVNLFFLFNGMWLPDIIQLLLFAPIFTPLFASLGVNPIHFGVIMVVNVMIGLITPPYGEGLYLASSISGQKMNLVIKETLPFTAVSITVLFIITYFPGLVLFLPRLFNLI